MNTNAMSARPGAGARTWIGVALLVAGLCGHLFAARAIGGYYIAYRDHIFGFVVLTLAAWVIVGILGRFFWRGRHDVTVLILGAVQAILGFVIYLRRFHV